MAILFYQNSKQFFHETSEVREKLAEIGIDYERWDAYEARVSGEATNDEILAAYEPEISKLKSRGGYVTADVINVVPETPGLEELLAKFDGEHTHSEDEVRFVVKGRGIFYFAIAGGDVCQVEMTSGDLIRIPAETPHWFTLGDDRTIRAIRLFKDPAGWVAKYTGR